MVGEWRRALVRVVAGAVGLLALGLFSLPAEAATTLTRTTTFTYDPVSGLMTQSVTEPSDPAFRVQTDFVEKKTGSE